MAVGLSGSYNVVPIKLPKNMRTKEQNSSTSKYADMMSMFINSELARNGNAYSNGIFVIFPPPIISSCFLITEEAIISAVTCSRVSYN